MAFSKDENGTITLRQGDSGEIKINGLNPDYNYNVYFAIRDENRELMFPELMVEAAGADNVIFNLTAELTDNLVVPVDENYAIYYWGVKAVDTDTGEETTLLPELLGQQLMIVCPKIVEGV